MRSLVCLLLILVSTSALAIEFKVSTQWKDLNTKEVVLECFNSGKYRCEHLCDNANICRKQEMSCKNCIGGDLFITNIYKTIGTYLQNSGREYLSYHVYDIFYKNNFITLTYDSIYNVVTRIDSKKMKSLFKRLCPAGTKNDPVIFVEVDETRLPIDLKFVSCDDKFFELTYTPDLYTEDAVLNKELY